MSDAEMTQNLVSLLRELYTEAGAFQWLTSPQQILGGHIAMPGSSSGFKNGR